VRESRLNRLRRFFLYDWPAAVRSVWKETLIISLIILLGALTSYSLVASNPEWYFNFVDESMSGGRDPRATVEFLQSTIGHGKAAAGESESGLHVFATYLFTHNSQVSIMSFALGFAFGVPTMMLEYYQGIGLGAMLAVFAARASAMISAAGCSSMAPPNCSPPRCRAPRASGSALRSSSPARAGGCRPLRKPGARRAR
jgi:hypothetical protein